MLIRYKKIKESSSKRAELISKELPEEEALEKAPEKAPEQALEKLPEQALEKLPEQALEKAPEQALEKLPEQALELISKEEAPEKALEKEAPKKQTEAMVDRHSELISKEEVEKEAALALEVEAAKKAAADDPRQMAEMVDRHSQSKMVDRHSQSKMEDRHSEAKAASAALPLLEQAPKKQTEAMVDRHSQSKMEDRHSQSKMEDRHNQMEKIDRHSEVAAQKDAVAATKAAINLKLKSTKKKRCTKGRWRNCNKHKCLQAEKQSQREEWRQEWRDTRIKYMEWKAMRTDASDQAHLEACKTSFTDTIKRKVFDELTEKGSMFTRNVEEANRYGVKTGLKKSERVWKECTELDEKTALSLS